MVQRGVSKREWLEKALEILEKYGIEDVKIDRLAKELGVARSGFYYHFKDRDDLLAHILDFWEQNFTKIISADSSIQKIPPAERLLLSITMVRDHHLSRYDLAMKSWARKDAQVSQRYDKVIQLRLGFVRALFEELGFSGDELETRTRLVVCYYSWAQTFFGEGYGVNTDELIQVQHKIFMQMLS